MNRNLKFLGVCLSLILLFGFSVISPAKAQQPVFFPGEVIEYEVSYIGIMLGTIKIVTEKQETVNGVPVMKAKAFIDSRQGIPFVSLHAVFNSWMDMSGAFSQQFLASTLNNDNNWWYDKYMFDYPKKNVVMESGMGSQKSKGMQFSTDKKWNDGLSLFFFARNFLNANRNIIVPTIIEYDTVKTTINFTGKRETVDIDAVKKPVRCVYFNGNANWTGLYGLSGKFEGWFSDDEARVPIKAKMKVYVGNVNIELVRWSRGSWQPPQ